MLSDFETPQAKLLQIILVGQPGLADKLASPSLIQLRQRITSVSGLSPLSSEEVGRFIEHRMKVAGYNGSPVFSPEALELISQVSEGIPRQINNYCFHALSLGCALRKKTVDANMIHEVIRDLDISRFVSDVASPRRMITTSTASSDPFSPVEELSEAGRGFVNSAMSASTNAKDSLSPAEAIEHMRDVARLLHNWRAGNGERQSA